MILTGVVDSWRHSVDLGRSDETEDFSQILDWLVWFLEQPDEFNSDNDIDLDAFPELC